MMRLFAQPLCPAFPVPLRDLLILAFAGSAVAVIWEPDHSASLPLVTGFVLWLLHFVSAIGLYVGLTSLAARWITSRALSALASILPLPLVFTPFSLVIDWGLQNDEGPEPLGIDLFADELIDVAPWSITVALILTWMASRQQNDTPSETQPSTPPPALHSLIRLEAQDHYVTYVTAEGSRLVSERFTDSIDKLDPALGLQCHRSHWINLQHVSSTKRAGSAYIAIMTNGDEVPVSRRRWSELKARLS